MIVVHIISSLNIGGAELMLQRLTGESLFTKHGVRHHVISLQDDGALGRLFKQQDVLVHSLNFKYCLLFPIYFFNLFCLIRQIRPNIVQTWMVHSDLMGGLAARLAGVDCVIWGVRATNYSLESMLTNLVRRICALLSGIVPNRIVCVAEASLSDSKLVGYKSSKLMVITNGFDVDKLSQSLGSRGVIRQSIGIPANSDILLVGCMGRYNITKDHANFIRAAGLTAAVNSRCRFVMIGRGLDLNNKALMENIEATGFKERFILLGEQIDPAVYLGAMDVFILSSITEGFPNALGEAMAMGVPCIATDVGDVEVLMGRRDWLVPARDSCALALKLQQMINLTNADRDRIGYIGRKRIVSNFSMPFIANQFLNLYQSLHAEAHKVNQSCVD